MESDGCGRNVREDAVLCVFCGRDFETTPAELAAVVRKAAAADEMRRRPASANIELEESAFEAAFDESAYYTWNRFHWPWELPRASWGKYWLRDQFTWIKILAVVVVAAIVVRRFIGT